MKKIFWILSVICIFISACLDEIELMDQQFDTKAVIIQGRLILGNPSTIEVSVQRIGDFDGFESANYVVGSKVKLINQNTGLSIDVAEDRSKFIYKTSIPVTGSFKVQTGDKYYIEVENVDGRRYRSKSESIYAVTKIEKFNFKTEILSQPDRKNIIQTDTFFRFFVNTSLLSNNIPGKFRWEITGVYKLSDNTLRTCYAPESIRPEKILIYDATEFNFTRLDSFLLVDTRNDFRFAEGYYMTLIQESLSPTAYTYWQQIKTLAQRNGNMFEAPPATVSTNIFNQADSTEKVFGYFYATSQDTSRLYIEPKPFLKYCPQPPTPRIGPTICDICLLLTGSSITKPSYWKE